LQGIHSITCKQEIVAFCFTKETQLFTLSYHFNLEYDKTDTFTKYVYNLIKNPSIKYNIHIDNYKVRSKSLQAGEGKELLHRLLI